MAKKWSGGLTFIDLFAGPGSCLIDKTVHEDGSPLIALQYGFSKFIFVEENDALMDALKKRCAQSPKSGSITFIQGDSNTSIQNVIKQMPSGNLNLAFIDPT